MYRPPWRRLIRAGHRRGGRLAAVRPLHGAGAVRAGPGLLRARRPQVRRAAASGSDFVTAPELTPLFGARAGAPGARRRWTPAARDELWEFGAGSRRAGRAAARCAGRARAPLHHRRPVRRAARAPARARCARFGDRVRWVDALPEHDARRGGRQRGARRDAGAAAALRRRRWFERGVVVRRRRASPGDDRPTALRPPLDGAVRARHGDRDPPAGRGLRRAPWPSALAARRGVLHRLRLSRRPSTTTRSAAAAR